jgi:hypothetical protein
MTYDVDKPYFANWLKRGDIFNFTYLQSEAAPAHSQQGFVANKRGNQG